MSKQREKLVGWNVRLGRVAGVEVRLHWTWGIAASVIALALAGNVFPAEVAGLSSNAYYAMGVATALLFFVSLLLHELGHALQARREGIPTREITLWMLGGVAQSDAPFETPGAEARVALAGPAVSAVLGAGLVAAGHLAGPPVALTAVLEPDRESAHRLRVSRHRRVPTARDALSWPHSRLLQPVNRDS